MNIAQKLINARGCIPRAEVAKAIGISVSAISMYENNQRIPRDEVKVKIANYYKTSVQDLFFDSNVTISDNNKGA